MSSTRWLAIRRWNVTHVLNTCSDTQRERERERENEREREIILPKKQQEEVVRRERERHTPPKIIHLRKRLKKSKTDCLSNARESLVFSTRDERYSLSWSRLTDSGRVLNSFLNISISIRTDNLYLINNKKNVRSAANATTRRFGAHSRRFVQVRFSHRRTRERRKRDLTRSLNSFFFQF